MHSSDITVITNCPCGHLDPCPPITRLAPVPPQEDTSLQYIITLPYSDTTEGPPFELCVAMPTAPSRTSTSLPTIAYAEVDGCQANHRQFFFESRGPKASDQIQIIWRMCVSGTLSISSDGKADKSLI